MKNNKGLTKTLTKKSVNINNMISTANQFVWANNQDFSEALKHITSLADMLSDLANQIGLNSKNSSIPPSKDTRKLNTPEEQSATQKNKSIESK